VTDVLDLLIGYIYPGKKRIVCLDDKMSQLDWELKFVREENGVLFYDFHINVHLGNNILLSSLPTTPTYLFSCVLLHC
jgi:hypothetical protein